MSPIRTVCGVSFVLIDGLYTSTIVLLNLTLYLPQQEQTVTELWTNNKAITVSPVDASHSSGRLSAAQTHTHTFLLWFNLILRTRLVSTCNSIIHWEVSVLKKP